MTEPCEQQPEAPSSIGEQVDEAVHTLTEQSAWMRERLGEEDWRRLTRLRDTWVRCHQVSAGAVGALKVALVAIAVGAGIELIARHPAGQVAPGASPVPYFFLLAPVALAAGWAGARVVEVLVSREMERLTWRGHSPEAVNRALWADLQARLLTQGKPEVVARARLQEESSRAPRWWRVEVSGFHLVLWLLIPALIAARLLLPHDSHVVDAVFVMTIMAWLLKGCFLLFLAFTSAQTRRPLLRWYRWCGTVKGTLVLVVLLPAAVCAIVLAIGGLMALAGR